MRVRRFLATAAATFAVITGVAVAPAPAQAVAATTLANTIALSNCSASLVRYPSSVSSDRAMMLTNGHCYEGGFLSAGQVLQNRTSSRSGTLLNSTGGAVATVRADRVLYATMTGTDVTLYRLTSTFATLQSRYGATALTIASSRPAAGTTMSIPSSYWKRIWNCKIDAFVPQLREGEWTWKDSIRYDTACDTIHGTSGSPIVSASTGQIIGINNTGNDDGERCTLNNPCEVAADGTITVSQGQSYGEQTYWFTTCLSATRTIDLTKSGCLLTKP
ncbi:trypsin-like peptidase domain-containing protein [Actinoplanes sp. LDG1-06]|uniref:Trypsin-like peptidase domain-containing protein n=1 Tax=Paractinoplanes ovalisporus TaxID=2810368 RepID=A0ABS2AHX2_9ACTN|nr:serine protease [Actinoplanes ovalisporus]MBM2618816.1 trypsin-like peptidase domain-containing protein [Actinoplanes ovalisporus]